MATIMRVRTIHTGVVGAPYLTTTYWSATTGVSPTLAQAAVDAMQDFWDAATALLNQSLSWTVSGVVDHVDTTTGDLTGSTGVTSRTGTGSGTTDMLPAASQGLLRLKTGAIVAGRRLQGHLFIPAPCESVNAAGVPTATYQTTLASAATLLFFSGEPDLLVFSRRHLTADIVTSTEVPATWAVLRSRRS